MVSTAKKAQSPISHLPIVAAAPRGEPDMTLENSPERANSMGKMPELVTEGRAAETEKSDFMTELRQSSAPENFNKSIGQVECQELSPERATNNQGE